MKHVRKQLSRAEREEIFRLCHYRCQKCNKNLALLPDERVIDHKIPLSKGGTNHKSNLWLLCSGCDMVKADSILPELQEEYIVNRLAKLESDKERRINSLLRRKTGHEKL